MAAAATEDYVPEGRSNAAEVLRDDDRESLAEWRSSEHVDNGSPSTSPPFWDTDDEDDDYGLKPHELFGKHTWKIENFSKEKKREMKSDQFEAGGYKWYILVYPQGCDVPNHLSLFLCVANHDKLLPGWSHFAQFTIAVVNVDHKKIKYSDTLHRFWKKEHDWGWKKFMELSKIQDGFLVDDVLTIKAQVQVIREKADRPFRCLDRPYRRELLRVYMANIEQIYKRFVEDRRSKLCKLIEDKARWSSFSSFWLDLDPSTQFRMSREKSDAILKVVVKQFFVEKEVTSTLVMDSLNTGYKALLYQSRGNKGKSKLVDLDELPAPMIRLEKEMFVLGSDVITLLERAVLETLPCQHASPKDEKSSQSRTKDGNSGEEHSSSSIEREERRLTELGRKILEIFVLSHIFSGIEIAYQEAVALRRQEELIREEAAGLFENDMKGKRGANEKDKRSKKKQTKQKKNNRKVKEKERDDKSDASILERLRDESSVDDNDDLAKQTEQVSNKFDSAEGASDTSDNGDVQMEVSQPESVEGSSDPANHFDDDANDLQSWRRAKSSSVDTSTCSADSIAPVVNSAPLKGNSFQNVKSQISPNRGKNQRSKGLHDQNGFSQVSVSANSNAASESSSNNSVCGTAPRTCEQEVEDQLHLPEQSPVQAMRKPLTVPVVKKSVSKATVEPAVPSKPKMAWSSSLLHGLVDKPKSLMKRLDQPVESAVTATVTSSSAMSPAIPAANAQTQVSSTSVSSKLSPNGSAMRKAEVVQTKEQTPPNSLQPVDRSSQLSVDMPQVSSLSNTETPEQTVAKVVSTSQSPATIVSRPSSAPLAPIAATASPAVSEAHVPPLLPRSVSVNEASRFGSDVSPSCSAPSYIPESYRNAIMGKTNVGVSHASVSQEAPSSLGQGAPFVRPLPTYASSASSFTPSTSSREQQHTAEVRSTAGPGKPDTLNSWNPWKDDSYQSLSNLDSSRQQWRDDSFEQRTNGNAERSGRFGGVQYRQFVPDVQPLPLASRHTQMLPLQGSLGDEFPHLDIINDLLEEEQIGAGTANGMYRNFGSPSMPPSFPDSMGEPEVASVSNSGRYSSTEQYYDHSRFLRMYNALSNPAVHDQQQQRDGMFSAAMDVPNYGSRGRTLLKPWMLQQGFANGFSHQPAGDYTNLTGRLNGDSVYRRANGHW